ncbi:MAG: hypothetical protein ABI397_03470 [Candidatus Saccharimonas sp.]
MRTVIIGRTNTEYARAVETFMEDFRRRTGRELEMLDPDTHDGDSFCRAYDIVEYPTVIAVDDNGQMQNMWVGSVMPTVSEVSFYV